MNELLLLSWFLSIELSGVRKRLPCLLVVREGRLKTRALRTLD
jgi:hypothetical protein